MSDIRFELTTPERIVVAEEIDGITLPTQTGEITVLKDHVPLVANLVPGMVIVYKDGKEEYLAISGGFVEIQPGNKVIVLADTAERAEELDMEKVEEARARAAKLLEKKRHAVGVSNAAMRAALNREMARLKVVKKYRGRRGSSRTPGGI